MNSVKGLLSLILSKVRENRDMCILIFSDHGDKNFLRSILNIFLPNAVANWASSLSLPEKDASLLFYFISGGAVSIIEEWLRGGFGWDEADLVAKRQAVIDSACNALKNRKELDMQVVAEEKVEPKRQQQQVTHKVKVEVLEGKSKKSKNKEWKERVLMLLEQVNLLCWSIDEFMYKKGVAFPCGEIMSVVDIIGKGQDPDLDKEFVVKLVTKKGEFYFAFKTAPEAIQWANMLRSATRASQS